MSKKILVTAALPYINSIQHLGHMVGCHFPADIFTRFHKTFGDDVVFVGGSDDHGTAILITAKELGLQPKEVIEKINNLNHKIYEKLCINYTFNSGTSTAVHEEVTKQFFADLDRNGYVVEGKGTMLFCEEDKIGLADRFVIGTCPKCGYEGAYGDQCDKCGETYEASELIDPKCKFCKKPAVFKHTKHLYFDLEKISNTLSQWLESKKNVFRPLVYAESKRWIDEGLKPRAITRDIPWGISVPKPGFEDKVFYVWFDAPIGYISITKELGGDEMVKDRWQNEDCEIYNFVGKDNIQFHTVFFPAMQLAGKRYNTCNNMFGYAFMNFEGEKFSKSKNHGIFCDKLLSSDIDIDTLRAYLATVLPEHKDSDFRWEGYRDNTNSEIVGKFGNFFNRTLNMIWKNFEGKLDIDINCITPNEQDEVVLNAIQTYPGKIAALFEKAEIRAAYKTIMEYASIGNVYLERTAPWTHIKNGNIDECRKILYLCLCLAKSLAIVASPILPISTQKIWSEQLGFDGDCAASGMWQLASKVDVSKNHQTKKPMPLYARIDDERLCDLKNQLTSGVELKELLKKEEN